MIRRWAVALTGALVLGTAATALTGGPAEAASTQKICSSKNSTTDVYVYSQKLDEYFSLDSRECVRLGKGDALIYMLSSYRVGYGGDYSGCRLNSGFTPWTKADRVYFRTYPGDYC
jgi:hypothetical protein